MNSATLVHLDCGFHLGALLMHDFQNELQMYNAHPIELMQQLV